MCATWSRVGTPVEKCPTWPGQPEQERLREARVRLAARQADVAAAQVHAGTSTTPPSTTVTSGRAAARSGEVLRGWVASSTRAPGARCSGPEQRVGRRRQQDHGVAAAHVVHVGRGRRRHPATHLRGERRRASGTPRATRSSESTAPDCASSRTSVVPTDPVAPTTATRRSGRSAEQGRSAGPRRSPPCTRCRW